MMLRSVKQGYLLLFVLLSMYATSVWSDSITIDPVSPTHVDSIIATISGCREQAIAEPDNISVEILKDNEIIVSAEIPPFGPSIGSCYERDVKIGILAPGQYRIGYFVTEDFSSPELKDVITIAVTELTTVDADLNIHIPSAIFQSSDGTLDIWADLEHKGVDADGDHIWSLKSYGVNR